MKNGIQAIVENLHNLQDTTGVNLGRNIGEELKDAKFAKKLKESVMANLDVERLLENDSTGYMAEDIAKLNQLMENVSTQIIRESSIGALTPAVALSHPLQFVNWIKSTIKNTIKVVVPDSTEIIKQVKKKYLVNPSTNERFELPYAFKDKSVVDKLMNGVLVKLVAQQPAKTINKDILIEAGGIKGKDSINNEFYVTSIVVINKDDNNKEVTIPVGRRITRSDRGIANINVRDNGKEYGSVMVNIDFKNGLLTTMSTDDTVFKYVNIQGTISPESNLHTLSTDWETDDLRFSIGAGMHMNTNVSHERIADTQLFYNIDQTKEVTDLMVDSIDQLKDVQLLGILDGYYEEIAGSLEGIEAELDVATPSGNYALDPVTWRSVQLKDYISRIAVELKKPLQSPGIFSIVGNSTVIGLLKDLNWVWNEGSDIGGISTNDAFGIMDHNGTTFKVTKSDRILDDLIRIFFLPSDPTNDTYTMFQHSTYITNMYNNPSGNIALPNVMVTDRYLTTKIFNIQGRLELIGSRKIFKNYTPNKSTLGNGLNP